MGSKIARRNLRRINQWVSWICLLHGECPRDISGRLGDALDMGGTMLFLVSRAASHITDAKIVLDGGSLNHNVAIRARL